MKWQIILSGKIRKSFNFYTREFFRNNKRQNSVIRIKIALNTSDSPFGWRGKNKGASVFFSDDTHFMHENHELKLNANNEVHFQLRVRNGLKTVIRGFFSEIRRDGTFIVIRRLNCLRNHRRETFESHTQQLGEPYSSCSSSKEAFHCGRIAAERQIRDKCKCSYGLLHRMHDEDPGKTHLPVCNFTSRIRCVNRFVIDYISDDHTLGTVSLRYSCILSLIVNQF